MSTGVTIVAYHSESPDTAKAKPREFVGRSTVTLSDRSLLRGTTAHTLLERFGHRLRSTAGGIGHASVDAEDEYEKSFEVEELDLFLSHSWRANWLLKYFTLVLYYNSVPAMITAVILAAGVTGMRFIEQLEPITNFLDFKLTRRHGVLTVASIGFFIVIFFWQDFLNVVFKRAVRSVFLDKVCIHQTNQEIKAKGIKAIGAYLGKSRKVLVTWDPTYFSRLWCTFELAAYKHARPEGEVCMLPVYIGGLVAALIASSFGCQVVTALLRKLMVGWVSEFALAAYMLVYGLQSFLVAACFRGYIQETNSLNAQLQDFSVRNADCFCCSNDHKLPGTGAPLSCDRKLVNASIAQWYAGGRYEEGLDKFDELIRTEFRTDMAAAFKGSRIPYSFVLLISIWAGFYQLDRMGPPRLYHCYEATSYECHCVINTTEMANTTLNHSAAEKQPNATETTGVDARLLGVSNVTALTPPTCQIDLKDNLLRVLEVINTVFLMYPVNLAVFIYIVDQFYSRVPASLLMSKWRKLLDLVLACLSIGMAYPSITLYYTLIRSYRRFRLCMCFMLLEILVVVLLYRSSAAFRKKLQDRVTTTTGRITQTFSRRLTARSGNASASTKADDPLERLKKDHGDAPDAGQSFDVTIEMADMKTDGKPIPW